MSVITIVKYVHRIELVRKLYLKVIDLNKNGHIENFHGIALLAF